jgi:DNA polymerase-1
MPLAEAFGFSNIKVDGYEADDVIASLVKRAREQKIPVMVVSGDRDVYQLVEDGVRVMTTSRGVTDTKIYDRDGVIERYGVPPELVTDLIGLKGDTSDNIPGVPGIGDKTAAQLLQEHGDLEGVLANIDKISGAKRKENLTNHAEDARISKQLATAVTDIDVELDLDELMSKTMDRSRLREVAREFELRVILQRLEEELGADFVPEGAAEERLDASAEEGTLADLPKGEIAVAIADSTWAAADAKRILSGEEPDKGTLVDALRAHPLIGHDIKSLGGGARHGLLAEAGRGPRPPPRHDGRRLPARSRPALLRPLRHRRAARPGRRPGAGEAGRRRPARAGGGATAGSRRRGAPGLGAGGAPALLDEGAQDRAADGRGRDAADRRARAHGADRRAADRKRLADIGRA